MNATETEAQKTLTNASWIIANDIAGYIRRIQSNKSRVTNRELNHILSQCQKATAQIGEAISQMNTMLEG